MPLSSTIFNHLWQSTLFAVTAAAVAFALRKNRAQARHWIWLIASLKFLVPFSLIAAVGSYFAPPTVAPAVYPELSAAVDQLTQPFTAPVLSIPVRHSTANPLPVIFFAVWFCGFIAVVLCWCARWRRIQAAVRAGRRLDIEAGIPVLSSPSLLEPGVFGVLRPVLLLPEGITDHLTRAQLHAIIAHELCHIRRRDNLAAAIHMLVEAIFWFHPLVWWIGARLMEERERACDEDVLRLGSEPQVYAESILKACEFYLESPLACMSGVTGADLKKRIVRIMTRHVGTELDGGRRLLLAVLGTAAVAAPLAFGLMHPQQTTQPLQSTARESFEVASIKPNNSGTNDSFWRDYRKSGKVITTNVSLRDYIERAYSVRSYQVIGPAWIKSARYDLNAEAPNIISEEKLQTMLQTLLAERFGLSLHREEKTLPVYELVVAKDGSKLQAAKDVRHSNIGGRRAFISGQAASVAQLAELLSRQTGRPVLNKTGLNGHYNFNLRWAPDDMLSMPDAEANVTTTNGDVSPSIFTAVQEQLGLKLVPGRDPVEILVVDHIDKVPTPN